MGAIKQTNKQRNKKKKKYQLLEAYTMQSNYLDPINIQIN